MLLCVNEELYTYSSVVSELSICDFKKKKKRFYWLLVIEQKVQFTAHDRDDKVILLPSGLVLRDASEMNAASEPMLFVTTTRSFGAAGTWHRHHVGNKREIESLYVPCSDYSVLFDSIHGVRQECTIERPHHRKERVRYSVLRHIQACAFHAW